MDFGPLVAGIVCILGGISIIVAIVFHWDWYMNHPKVRWVYKMLGETGAPVFHVVCGLVFVIMGVLMIGWFIFEVMDFMASG